MLLQALSALTHVASQLSYQWLAPPAPTPLDLTELARVLPNEIGLNDLSVGDWLDLISWELQHDRGILPWLPRYVARGDHGRADLAQATWAHLAAIERAGAAYLTYHDKDYPPLLRMISDPPTALSVYGDHRLLTRTIWSVVGSRKASAWAMAESFALGRGLAALPGAAVASGGAYGCDIAAHHGVLASGVAPAPAVLVFAGGLVELYPKGNAGIFEKLSRRRAAFISERLWQAHCLPRDFSARNRIIAGMTRRVFVMQAAARSGAAITARLALDQGRDVSVLVHPENDVRAAGSRILLADGAEALESAAQFLSQCAKGATPKAAQDTILGL